ncbi:hypothetical protein A946_06585 [Methylacidiphilum kamchatkense Kam1]|uniref:Uncharacterized protein n=1 Tax=Methylacidiphilum kamchatkense Kam1 TaxID=1202785 RepID=A0ABR4ZWF0_9BACT|nr:hypothetical protein A946_06585 [Methylacidiphilum kamchatkense Kam1]
MIPFCAIARRNKDALCNDKMTSSAAFTSQRLLSTFAAFQKFEERKITASLCMVLGFNPVTQEAFSFLKRKDQL